jgi:hypothetical protein
MGSYVRKFVSREVEGRGIAVLKSYSFAFQKWVCDSAACNCKTGFSVLKYCIWSPMCFYLVVVVELACTNDPERYVGGSAATGRIFRAEQVEG